jgi:hypothetical protein
MARGAYQATLGLGKVRATLCQWHNVFKKKTLRRTGIDVEVRQVKHFDAFPTRFLRRRQWIRFWFGKPVGEVQRGRRCKRTGLRDEVLANQLKQREYGQQPSNIECNGSRVTARTWPSYPEMFALATTCVSTEPNVVALNVLLQLLESLNC